MPVNAGVGRSVTLLCIGDSLTNASVYTGHLLTLCKNPGNPHLTLVGTHHRDGEPEANRHEGYGGWTAELFITHYTGIARTGDDAKRGSPFLYADRGGKPHLDFARYCRENNSGQAPKMVTIFLGCNDTFLATDENLTAAIDRMLNHYNQLIAMIHGYDKSTKIGVVLVVPPAVSQDAFGASYGCGQTRWQYKRNQHETVCRMMEQYENREQENLWVIPAYMNLDCRHNYPQAMSLANAHTTQMLIRQKNDVHPAPGGYCQIGDSIYGWLKSVLVE